MPFSLQCTNSGCHQLMEPYIDKKTDKVYCSVCEGELNVTYFAKVQMKSMKQFKPKKMSFAVTCQNCKDKDQPKVVDNNIVCPSCNKIHSHLSEPFKLMLIESLKTVNKDI